MARVKKVYHTVEAKTSKEWTDNVRKRIQASQMVNRLIDFASGKEGVDISKERLRAIEILLKKVLPDLSSIQLTGDAEKPVEFKFVWQDEPKQ